MPETNRKTATETPKDQITALTPIVWKRINANGNTKSAQKLRKTMASNSSFYQK